MKNIEIKARCHDLELLKSRVLEKGGTFEKSMHHIDTYFNVPKGRLKLREIDGISAVLIYYERTDSSVAKESNFYIHKTKEPESLKDVLTRSMGVKVIVDKQRELYLIKNTRIHLDTVAGLGTFMELETQVNDQGDDEAFEENSLIIKTLGIKKEDMIEGSYSDLLLSR